MPIAVRCLLVLMLAAAPAAAAAAPKADLWPRWTEHDADGPDAIDHTAWTRFLQRFRRMGGDGVARLDYGAARDNGGALDDYIDRLTGLEISRYPRDVQMAYWINLYNALTVDVVLEHYPVDSIRDIDISPGWFSSGPWGAELVEVEGEPITLNDIEHRILRPIWADPRIHYAVNCASIGCPNLQPEAFTADNHERLLERGAERYINHARGAALIDDELVVSSIYHWFQADFGGTQAGVLEHLREYADDDLASKLEGRTDYGDHRYDWSLNDVE